MIVIKMLMQCLTPEVLQITHECPCGRTCLLHSLSRLHSLSSAPCRKNKILHHALSCSYLPPPRYLLARGCLPALPTHVRLCLPHSCSPRPRSTTLPARRGRLHRSGEPTREGELHVKPSRQRVALAATTRQAPCVVVDLRAAVNLHNDKSPFIQATR
jgi:hypothetical protein